MKPTFSRRLFLQSATAATLAAAVPIAWKRSAMAQDNELVQPENAAANATSYRFKFGEFDMISISDGVLSVPAAVFAGNASASQLADVLQQGFQTETLTLDCNVLFVDTGRNKVLVDVGGGTLTAPTAGKLLTHLQSLQISPADIDTIIITHAHPDHVGGLLDAADALVFPVAQYFVSRAEYEFWTDLQVSLPNLNVDQSRKQESISVAQKHLSLITDRMTLFESEQEILPGFSAIPAAGHTAGQVAIRITSGNVSMVHTADVVHTHTINLWHPEWQPAFDAEPAEAVATRQRVLESIATERQLMFAYHFPFPGLGHIRPREQGGFTWEPTNWQFEG